MNIRQAHIDDAEGIGQVHVDSWRSTYKGLISNKFLDNLSYADKEAQWKTNLTDSSHFIIVAEINSQIVGYAAAQHPPGNNIENASHLTSIYILKEHQGNGIGKQLLYEMFTYFNRQNISSVYVEILKENATTCFYEKFGAKFVRDFDIQIGGRALKESLYLWPSVKETLHLLSNERARKNDHT